MPLRLLAAFLLAVPLAAAQPSDTLTAGAELEDLLEAAAVNGADEALAARLEDLAARPLDLNSARAAEIALLPGLSPLTAQAIVRFREQRAAPLRALDQLLAVDGVTADELALIAPFVAFRQPAPAREAIRTALADLRVSGVHRVAMRVEPAEGFRDGRYPGPRTGLLTRTRVTAGGRAQANLTLEHDPGEPLGFGAGRPAATDFASAHVAAFDVGPLRTLVLGDFTVAFGEGVVAGRVGGLGKSRDVTGGVARAGSGVRPYGSSAEAAFQRGGAASVALPLGLTASAWGSLRAADARTDTVGGAVRIVSLAESGLHRTETERARRGAVRAREVGAALEWTGAAASAGVLAASRSYTLPVVTSNGRFLRDPDPATDYRGASLFGGVGWEAGRLFGEVGVDGGGRAAGVAGVSARAGRGTTVVLHARSADAGFEPVQGGAFAEQSAGLSAEQGLYAAVTSRVAPTVTLNLYADAYRLTTPSRLRPRPTPGLDLLADLRWKPRRWLALDATLRTERRDASAPLAQPGGADLAAVGSERRSSARVQASYRYSDDVRLRLRGDLVRARDAAPGRPALGTFAAADVRWRAGRRLLFDVRAAVFDVEAFEARVYAYEHDLRYRFTVPAFSGRGVRHYVVARYDAWRGVRLEARFAQTVRSDAASIGSGASEVASNRVRDVSVQVLVDL